MAQCYFFLNDDKKDKMKILKSAWFKIKTNIANRLNI
jgi:hypothetical protein